MKYFIRKWYKVILSVFAGFANTAGLVLSIIEITSGTAGEESIKVYIVLGLSELFLIGSVIFSLWSVLKNKSEQINLEEKNNQIERLRDAERIIFENQKSVIATYKDCKDALDRRVEDYLNNHKRINPLLGQEKQKDTEIHQYVIEEQNAEYENFKLLLIDDYHRFLGSITNNVRRSLEEYLAAKGCKKGVSITVKQMETPQIYNNLNDHKAKVYTAFRDYRTYASKHRNETWGKEFTIAKNSDFVISIEKDYYIFNFVEKKHLDTGLYQNENTNFYEHYNSGITCAIYSCIRKERTLFGYLACDSLFDKKDREKTGPDIFDWKAANIMMHAAQIIAMYLQLFNDVWDRYCIYFKAGKAVKGTEKTCREQIAYLEELIKQIKVEDEKNARIVEKEELEDMVKKNNFCRVIRDTVEKRRYNN